LSCIDTTSNLVELIRMDNKMAEHIWDKFVQSWLCCYPWPIRSVHDKGGKFIGKEFQWLLEIFSIKDVCSTSKNPQSNAIFKRMHQTVENVFILNLQRTCLRQETLLTTMHWQPQCMPWGPRLIQRLVAHRVHWPFLGIYFLNVPLVADWKTIARKREQHVKC
jgi:hypothetical protein